MNAPDRLPTARRIREIARLLEEVAMVDLEHARDGVERRDCLRLVGEIHALAEMIMQRTGTIEVGVLDLEATLTE